MALTIVATAGSATANSYATLAEAETYMEGRLNGSLWTAATDATKDQALVEAQRELTPLVWLGLRADTTQVLAWPRQDVINPDDPSSDYYGTTTVPQRVKDAQSELAFQFIKAGTTDLAAQDATQGILEKTIDVLTTKYAAPYTRTTGINRYPRVMRYIRALLAGGSVGVPMVKG